MGYEEGALMGLWFGVGERLGECWLQAQLAMEGAIDLEPWKRAGPA